MKEAKAEKAAKRAGACGLPKIDQLPGRIEFDATLNPSNFQAAYLVRRLGALDPALLATLAGLVFGEVRQ